MILPLFYRTAIGSRVTLQKLAPLLRRQPRQPTGKRYVVFFFSTAALIQQALFMSRRKVHADTFTLIFSWPLYYAFFHPHFVIRVFPFAKHGPILLLQRPIDNREFISDWWSVCTEPHFLLHEVTKLVPYRTTLISAASIYFDCVTDFYAKINLTNTKCCRPQKRKGPSYYTPIFPAQRPLLYNGLVSSSPQGGR